jgi:hypothetical protein
VGGFSLIGAEDLHATHQDDASPQLHVTAADETLSKSEEDISDLQTSESASDARLASGHLPKRGKGEKNLKYKVQKHAQKAPTRPSNVTSDYGACPEDMTGQQLLYKMIRQNGDCFEVMGQCGLSACVHNCPGGCSKFSGAPNACSDLIGKVCCPCSESDKQGYIMSKVAELLENAREAAQRARRGKRRARGEDIKGKREYRRLDQGITRAHAIFAVVRLQK